MQLSSLEIKGFKSFGDKISINFDEGITAIVGPNGCGKSNVVDAIRWVLGEQSTRMLRSEKMENLIFNGTKTRKAANLAEVSLTFNNTKNILPTEYATVTITRKLYRSGESEYRLNDVSCRLKDIVDLFLDTGIGADSYSIIELKMVDELLNNKENSRRQLFEEAAGISKYKVRKKQTINKLKDTEADLSRVDDLLFEIEKNLKTLENQAKKTEKYYKLKELYKEFSRSLAAFKIFSFQQKTNVLTAQEEDLVNQKIEIIANGDHLQAGLQQLKLDTLNEEKNLSAQQKATNEYVGKLRNAENDQKLQSEQLSNLLEKVQDLEKELQADRKTKQEAEENLAVLRKAEEQEKIEIELSKNLLETLKESAHTYKSKQEEQKKLLTDEIQKRKDLNEKIKLEEREMAIQRTKNESLQNEKLQTSNESEKKEGELAAAVESIKVIDSDLTIQKKQLEILEIAEQAIEEKDANLSVEIDKQKEFLASENRILDSRQNEYNLTKSLIDNLEGFPESIKFLKKNTNWSKKAPLLSDILFCNEEYRIAIENYLQPFLNYYVVDDADEAIQAIRLLSESSKGRADFFILNSIPNKKIENLNVNSNSVSALSVIETEDRYAILANYLLGNVIISENETVTTANPINDQVILSKNGQFSKSTISLSGGSVGLFEGKRIGRAKNLELLEKQIQEHVKNTAKSKQSIADMNDQKNQLKLQSAKKEIAEIQSKIKQLENQKISADTRQEQFQAFITSNLSKAETIVQQLKLVEQKIQEIEPKLQELYQEERSLNEKISLLEREMLEINEFSMQQSSKFNEENIRFHQKENKLHSIKKDVDYRGYSLSGANNRILKNETELSTANEKIKVLMLSSETVSQELGGMYDQKTAMEKGLLEMEEAYYDVKLKINSFEDSLVENRKKQHNIDELLTSLKEKKNELLLNLHSLRERLSVEFEINIDEINADEVNEADSEQDLIERTEKLRSQITNYGPINPLALTAFEEMNERFTFINTQKEDLLQSKKSLLETIKEIDDTAKERFLEAFTKIRANFIEVFRSLFNEEDSCDLILSDPNDPLESDIDIIAKPKGKRPLTINQLSGGEKTLTATAILFSLYLLKPAPFCIFDEVDAPLDDTNIDKFNGIIRKFSDNSQFIVVTHNKRTIASTDIVYGVTMIEPGISKVVPVYLREIKAA